MTRAERVKLAKAARERPKLQWVVPGSSSIHSPDVPLTAKELRDWKGRVVAGRFFLRPDNDGWSLYVNTVVGRRGPLDTVALVEEFALFREGLAALKRHAADKRELRP